MDFIALNKVLLTNNHQWIGSLLDKQETYLDFLAFITATSIKNDPQPLKHLS